MTVLSLIAISIIHVHLNMFTVENPVNPSFWIAFIFECNPFGGGNWRILAELLMMGIQCIVTSIFAIYILKWDNIRKWFLSFIICAVTYIFLRQFLDVLSNHIMIQFYDNIYGYGGASECCIVFSILQIVYILVYVLLRTLRLDQVRSGDAVLWSVQKLEKKQRNKIIKELCDQGAGFRQLARITGISYGIIQRVVTDQRTVLGC